MIQSLADRTPDGGVLVKLVTGKGERRTGMENGERETKNGKRRTGNGERGTGV